jgi:hypothetical protein
MTRPSKRFTPSKLQDALVPAILAMLGLILLVVIILAVLAGTGILRG